MAADWWLILHLYCSSLAHTSVKGVLVYNHFQYNFGLYNLQCNHLMIFLESCCITVAPSVDQRLTAIVIHRNSPADGDMLTQRTTFIQY